MESHERDDEEVYTVPWLASRRGALVIITAAVVLGILAVIIVIATTDGPAAVPTDIPTSGPAIVPNVVEDDPRVTSDPTR